MIGALSELSTYVLGFFEFLVQTHIFKKLSELGTCTPLSMRFLAVYCSKKSFLSNVKGMNDRGIMQTFHICARFLRWVHVSQSARGFLTFKVGKTQFRGLSEASCQLSK